MTVEGRRIAGVRPLLGLAAAVMALALTACGGGERSSSGSQAVELPTVTAPNSTGSVDTTGKQAPEAGGSGNQAKGSKPAQGSAAPAAGAKQTQGCPPGASRRQCALLAQHADDPVGKAQDPKDCLATHSRAECKAIAQAQKNAPPGQTLTPENCVELLGQAQCEALAQAQGR